MDIKNLNYMVNISVSKDSEKINTSDSLPAMNEKDMVIIEGSDFVDKLNSNILKKMNIERLSIKTEKNVRESDSYWNGYYAGYGKGYKVGQKEGFGEGYQKGLDSGDGYYEGYQKGYADGKSSCRKMSEKKNNIGLSETKETARRQSKITKEGCESDYDRGERIGFEDGRKEGYDKAYGPGHEAAYAQNKQNGYEAGYAQGKKDGESGNKNFGYNFIILLICVSFIVCILTIPTIASNIPEKNNMDSLVVRALANMKTIAEALSAYKLENGEYPDTLEKLKGKYLKEIPKDPATSIFFEYKPRKIKNQGRIIAYTLTPSDLTKYNCNIFLIPDKESYSTLILSYDEEVAKKTFCTDALIELGKMKDFSHRVSDYYAKEKNFPEDLSSIEWPGFKKEDVEEFIVQPLNKNQFILKLKNPQKFGCKELILTSPENIHSEYKIIWQ